ncbi:hypothetical protein CCACVL1_01832, partial [Corchorus capsularis]
REFCEPEGRSIAWSDSVSLERR